MTDVKVEVFFCNLIPTMCIIWCDRWCVNNEISMMFSRRCREEHTPTITRRDNLHNSRITCDLVSHVGQSTFDVVDGGKKERGNTKRADLPAWSGTNWASRLARWICLRGGKTLVRSLFARTFRRRNSVNLTRPSSSMKDARLQF